MKKLIAGLVAIGVAAWPAATWFYGQRAQASAEQFSAAITQAVPYLSVASSEYSKGFMSSTHTLRMRPSLPALPGKTWPEIVIQNKIEHGPFPGFSTVAAARISHSIVWPAEVKAQLTKLWGEKEPLSMLTTIAIGGGGVTTVTSPAATGKFDTANVAFQGLNGRMNFTAGFEKIDYVLDIAGASVEDPQGKLSVGKISSSGSQTKLAGTERVYTGKQTAKFDSLELDSKGQSAAAIRGMTYNVETSAPEANLLSGAGKFNGASLKVAGIDLGGFDYDYSMSKLHAPSVEAIGKALQNANPTSNTPEAAKASSDAMIAAVQKHLPELSRHVPKFNLDRFRIGTLQDYAQINGSMFLKPLTAEESKSMMAALPKLDASFNIEVTDSIIRMLVDQTGKRMMAGQAEALSQLPPEQRATMQTQMEQQTKMMVDEQIAQLVQQGLVVRAVGKVSSQIALKDGKLTVNGKEVGQGLLAAR